MKTKIIRSNIILKPTSPFSSLWKGFRWRKKINLQEAVYFVKSVEEFLKIYSNIVTCFELSLHTVSSAKYDLLKTLSLIKKGSSLSQAFESEQIFSANIISILKIGEKNNDLSGALNLIVVTLENQIEREQNFWVSMLYPLFVLVVFFITLMLFSQFVLPSLMDLVTELNSDLVDRFLFVNRVIRIVENALLFMFFSLLFLVGLYTYSYELFESCFLYIPYVKSFFCCKNFSLFCFYIQASLKNNISIEASLGLSLRSFKGKFFNLFSAVKRDLVKGHELSVCLVKHSLVPKFFVDIIQTGEKSNNLIGSFDSAYKIFNDKEKRFIARFTVLLPIILISFIGCLLILFVWFLLLPLYSLGVA